jgi:hypothetical protein
VVVEADSIDKSSAVDTFASSSRQQNIIQMNHQFAQRHEATTAKVAFLYIRTYFVTYYFTSYYCIYLY